MYGEVLVEGKRLNRSGGILDDTVIGIVSVGVLEGERSAWMRENPKSLVISCDGRRHVFHRWLELLVNRSDVEPFL